MDSLSILACRVWGFCWIIELIVCGNKDVEECKKEGIFFSRMYTLFNINVDFSFGPILVS